MDGVRDGLKMRVQSLLGCFVIVRGHQQHAVRACFFRLFGKIDRRLRTVGAGARDHGDPSRRLFHAETDHIQMLLMGERGCLARGAADYDGVRPARDLRLDMLREFLIVDASVLVKGRNDGNARSCKNGHMYLLFSFGRLRRPSNAMPPMAAFQTLPAVCRKLPVSLTAVRKCAVKAVKKPARLVMIEKGPETFTSWKTFISRKISFQIAPHPGSR